MRNRVAWVRITGIVLGMLMFLSANYARSLPCGFQQFPLSQLWKFQRIIHLIGLGVVVASMAGKYIDKWAIKIVEIIDKWLWHGRSRTWLALWGLVLLYTIVYSGFTFYRHYSFNSTGYDLAIQDQVVWNTAHGRPFESSIEVRNYLGDHIQPYLALLALFYLLIPSPYILLAFQSLVLALSALPLYHLAKRKFSSPTIALALVFCSLAYPPLGFLNRFDFHGEVIAVPLLIAACERLDAKDLKSAVLVIALALFAKEDIGLTIAALGLAAALYQKEYRRFGLITAFVSASYSLLAVLVIIPMFRGEPSDTLARYQWLGDTPAKMVMTIVLHPDFVLENIVEAQRITTLLQLLAPLAFLPLLSPRYLLPIVPALGYNFLARNFCQPTIYCQYMTPVIPFMITAGVIGLYRMTTSTHCRKIMDWVWSHRLQRTGLGVSILMLATIASWTYQNPLTDNTVVPSAWLVQPNETAIREGLKLIPNDTYLVTTNAYAPHLAHRRQLRILMYDLAT
jgi:uncharacterized membrane protein